MKQGKTGPPLLGLLAGLALLLAACGPAATESLSPLGTPAPVEEPWVDESQETFSPLETPTADLIVLPPWAQEILTSIQLDLARQLNVDAGQVLVTRVEATNWPDASLGCPKPGTMYASVLTPGYRVVLEVKGQEVVYHTGPDSFVRCEMGVPVEEPGQESRQDLDEAALLLQARQDLGQRIGLSQDAITILDVEAVQWPDTSLGCPKPGMLYAQVVTPGYRIVLSAAGEKYQYHSDAQQVFLCER